MALRLILFDLDGTLADTAPDIARATNQVLAEYGQTPLSLERVRELVSSGSAALFNAGFNGSPPSGEAYRRLIQRLFDVYAEAPAQETVAFAGLTALIDELDAQGAVWSVVTNKPERLARPVIAALGMQPAPGCIIGGDTLPARKPDPLPLIKACRHASTDIDDALYVGDAEIDVQAARAAGMPVVIAGYGYAPDSDTVTRWKPDFVADTVAELRRILLSLIATAV